MYEKPRKKLGRSVLALFAIGIISLSGCKPLSNYSDESKRTEPGTVLIVREDIIGTEAIFGKGPIPNGNRCEFQQNDVVMVEERRVFPNGYVIVKEQEREGGGYGGLNCGDTYAFDMKQVKQALLPIR